MSVLFERTEMLRLQRGLSVRALEIAAQIGEGSIRNWNDSIPSGDKILRVANVLDASVDYLLGNTDNPQSHKNDIVNVSPAVTEILKVLNKATETTVLTASNAEADIKGILSAYHLESVDDSAINEDMLSTVDDEKA